MIFQISRISKYPEPHSGLSDHLVYVCALKHVYIPPPPPTHTHTNKHTHNTHTNTHPVNLERSLEILGSPSSIHSSSSPHSYQEACPTSTSSSSTWLANPTKYHYVGRWVDTLACCIWSYDQKDTQISTKSFLGGWYLFVISSSNHFWCAIRVSGSGDIFHQVKNT